MEKGKESGSAHCASSSCARMAEEGGEDEVPTGYIDEEEQDKKESPKDPKERDEERGFNEDELAHCMKVVLLFTIFNQFENHQEVSFKITIF